MSSDTFSRSANSNSGGNGSPHSLSLLPCVASRSAVCRFLLPSSSPSSSATTSTATTARHTRTDFDFLLFEPSHCMCGVCLFHSPIFSYFISLKTATLAMIHMFVCRTTFCCVSIEMCVFVCFYFELYCFSILRWTHTTTMAARTTHQHKSIARSWLFCDVWALSTMYSRESERNETYAAYITGANTFKLIQLYLFQVRWMDVQFIQMNTDARMLFNCECRWHSPSIVRACVDHWTKVFYGILSHTHLLFRSLTDRWWWLLFIWVLFTFSCIYSY